MDIIKRKILLEDSTDRTYNSPTWGSITATSFYINVILTQNVDDMGLFTDMSYITNINNSSPDYSTANWKQLTDKLSSSGITFPFMTGATPSQIVPTTNTDKVTLRLPSSVESNYYVYGNLPITGSTDSKIEDVRSYRQNQPYIIGFNIDSGTYQNYDNISVDGVNRVVSLGNPSIYVFDAVSDTTIGTPSQKYGLQYTDYTGLTRQILVNGDSKTIPLTNFRYIGEGINQTNVSLSALTKEEYLFGIVEKPIVQSDVDIDRGITSVMDIHLRLSEIKDLDELVRYGNGYYNITTE